MQRSLPQADWEELSALVAQELGLDFPAARRVDLERGLQAAALELGFQDGAACCHKLLSGPPDKALIRVLATHLTIGETYFFRDAPLLGALAESILPELICARRGRDQRIRIWSAGCASGEEAYTLAILLHQLLPDLAQWRVTILATDVNAVFLKKAVAGIYGEWSFRNEPAGVRARYFSRIADGRYAVADRIRKLVSFGFLNLAQDGYPSLGTGTNAMDIVFCRNVLMYFSPSQMQAVLGKFHSALVEGGWLAVSPSETAQALYPQFQSVGFPGATYYRKNGAASAPARVDAGEPRASIGRPVDLPDEGPVRVDPAWQLHLDLAAARPAVPAKELESPLAAAQRLYAEGRYSQAIERLVAADMVDAMDPHICSLCARAHANLGRLTEALQWCDRWIDGAKTDALAHYLRAMVLLEQGLGREARLSLQRATYLDPGMVLAHFALGNLARSGGDEAGSKRHFANTLRALRRYQPQDVLPQSEGLSAGSLAQTLRSMAASDEVGSPQ